MKTAAVLEDRAFSGRPSWPCVSSSLYAAFLAGVTGDAHIVIITWNASLHGWGMVLRWRANPDSDDMRHQVRREALAGVLAFEAAALELDRARSAVGRAQGSVSQGYGFDPDLSHKAYYMPFICRWRFEIKLRFFSCL